MSNALRYLTDLSAGRETAIRYRLLIEATHRMHLLRQASPGIKRLLGDTAEIRIREEAGERQARGSKVFLEWVRKTFLGSEFALTGDAVRTVIEEATYRDALEQPPLIDLVWSFYVLDVADVYGWQLCTVMAQTPIMAEGAAALGNPLADVIRSLNVSATTEIGKQVDGALAYYNYHKVKDRKKYGLSLVADYVLNLNALIADLRIEADAGRGIPMPHIGVRLLKHRFVYVDSFLRGQGMEELLKWPISHLADVWPEEDVVFGAFDVVERFRDGKFRKTPSAKAEPVKRKSDDESTVDKGEQSVTEDDGD